MSVIEFFLSGVCHQLPEHCLYYEGRPLPLCARCMGTFLGVLIALFALWAIGQDRRSRLPTWRVGLVLAGLTGLWALDGLNSVLEMARGSWMLYQPQNSLRLITGMGNGVTIGVVLYPIGNAIMWRWSDDRRVLDRPWHLLVALLAEAGCGAAVLAWRSAPYLFWVVVDTLSVSVVLATVNAALIVLLLHKENLTDDWLRMLPYLGVGFLAACAETGTLALVRRALGG